MGFFSRLFRRKRTDAEESTPRRGRFHRKKLPKRDDSPTQPVIEEKQEIEEVLQENAIGKSEESPLVNGPFNKAGPDLSDGTQRPVLSSRNVLAENLVNPRDVVSPRSPRSPRSMGPVDLDEVSDSAPEEEPELSKPMFTMPDSSPRFSAGKMDVDSEDGESSFNYSTDTDAVDNEYAEARRRLGAIGALSEPNFHSSNSIVTADTDGETSVFPMLNSEDEGTMGTASISKEAERNSLLNLPKVNPITGQSLVEEPFVSSPTALERANPKDRFGAKKEQMRDKNIKLASSKRDSPERTMRRPVGFTTNSTFMDAVYGNSKPRVVSPQKNTNQQPNFDPFAPALEDKAFKDPEFSGDDGFDFADFDNAFRPKKDDNRSSFEKKLDNSSSYEQKLDNNSFEKKLSFPEKSEPQVSLSRPSSSSRSVAHEGTSLSQLLERAKSKTPRGGGGSRKAGNSVSSAPAISAEYLRRTHGLPNRKDTSVTEIIQSLEAASASRHSTSTHSLGSRHHRTASQGDDQLSHHSRGTSSVRSRERLRRRRERRNKKDSEFSSDSEEENDASESWLFDEVTGALGPRGIAADLESLSGRSNRSASSRGGISHKSHRSHRSSRSKRHSSRKQGSGDSVDSRHSRESRRSRSSRYSTRSYISQMSEQSRSVANDLRRLEMQLAMVGGGSTEPGSVRSRVSRSKSSRSSSVRRSRVTVTAPPGKLGIILANKADSKGTVVSGVRTSSVLADRIAPGDRIVAIDGEDVSLMTVSEITTIMARKADFDRTLTILTTPRTDDGGDSFRYRK